MTNTKDKPLLLLDINGVLCIKITKLEYNKIIKDNTDAFSEMKVIKLLSYYVVVRPGCYEFLDFVYTNFDVGYFSSTTQKNARGILNSVISQEQEDETKVFWFRDRTHFDPDSGSIQGVNYITNTSATVFDTIKLLSDIYDNPILNHRRQYNGGNTILCDDSERKTRFNNSNNVIIFPKFDGNKDDVVLFEMMDIISERFEMLKETSKVDYSIN